jgi:hypothetical protein
LYATHGAFMNENENVERKEKGNRAGEDLIFISK